MKHSKLAYWHLTGVLVVLAFIAQADLRPVSPAPSDQLEGRGFHFREAYRLPAGKLQSAILFAHQWFQDSHLGAWEAGCRLVARYVSDEDRITDPRGSYRIARVKRTSRPYWYEVVLANEDGSRADFNLACGLTENEDRDNRDDLALMVRLSDGVNWESGPIAPFPSHPDHPTFPPQSEERWRCFAEGRGPINDKPFTESATCASRAEAENAALLRCHRQGEDCQLIYGQCFRLPDHGAAYPLDCER